MNKSIENNILNFLTKKYPELSLIETPYYPGKILFLHKNKTLCCYDKFVKVAGVDYLEIWSLFEDLFELPTDIIERMLRRWLEESNKVVKPPSTITVSSSLSVIIDFDVVKVRPQSLTNVNIPEYLFLNLPPI